MFKLTKFSQFFACLHHFKRTFFFSLPNLTFLDLKHLSKMVISCQTRKYIFVDFVALLFVSKRTKCVPLSLRESMCPFYLKKWVYYFNWVGYPIVPFWIVWYPLFSVFELCQISTIVLKLLHIGQKWAMCWDQKQRMIWSIQNFIIFLTFFSFVSVNTHYSLFVMPLWLG